MSTPTSAICYFRLESGWLCPECRIVHNCSTCCPLCLTVAQISLGNVLNRTTQEMPRNKQQERLDAAVGFWG